MRHNRLSSCLPRTNLLNGNSGKKWIDQVVRVVAGALASKRGTKMQPNLMCTEGGVPQDKTPDVPCCQPQVPVLAELLLCSEPTDPSLLDSVRSGEECEEGCQSFFDPAILHHPEVMKRLKALELMMKQPKNYFATNSKNDILPYMRKIVASWMLEVCEEQRCDEAVFPLAVGILDQFLATCNIKKEQLQMVACVCLLLASKSRQCNHFSLELLSWYTDSSVSVQSLRTWELVILSQLNWDVNVMTAHDFVDFILVRSPAQGYSPGNKYSQLIRRHAVTFISLCYTEPRFVGWKPSLIAASAIYTAMKGMRREDTKLATGLASMAEVSVDQLMAISSSIDQVISAEVGVVEQQTADVPLAKNVGISATVASKKAYPVYEYNSASKLSAAVDAQDILV